MARQKSALASSEARLAQLYLDIAGVIILAINNEGIITEINRKGCEVLGYPKNEIIGKNWFTNFIPEKSRKQIHTNFRQMLSGAIKLEQYENPVLTREGSERMIAWHNTYLRDGDGNIVGTLSSGEDITERKRLELELEKYRQRLEEGVAERTADYSRTAEQLDLVTVQRNRAEANLELRVAMMEKAPEAIFLIDAAGNLLYANEAACEVFEFERKKLTGMSFWQLVQPQSTQIVESALKELAEKRDLEYETFYIRKDGTALPVLVHSRVIGTSNGDLILSIVHDITNQKQKEERLRLSEMRTKMLLLKCRRQHQHHPMQHGM